MAEQIEKKAPSADKLKALQLAMEKIEKEHGKGTIMKMGEENVEDVSSSCCPMMPIRRDVDSISMILELPRF